MELERIQGTTDSDSMRSTSQVQLGGCQPWKVVQVQLEEPLTWLESYICSIFSSNYSRHQVERSMTWNSWISRRKGNPYSTFGGAVDGSYPCNATGCSKAPTKQYRGGSSPGTRVDRFDGLYTWWDGSVLSTLLRWNCCTCGINGLADQFGALTKLKERIIS